MKGSTVGWILNPGDVPELIRDQLFAEEHHRVGKRQKPVYPPAGSMCPPININLGPTQLSQSPKTAYGRAETNISGQTDLEIAGPIEEIVEEYTNWHLEKLHNPNIGAEFLVKEGVNIGAAYRFVSDTTKWLKQRKRKRGVNNDDVEKITYPSSPLAIVRDFKTKADNPATVLYAKRLVAIYEKTSLAQDTTKHYCGLLCKPEMKI
ncbi:predicted protein [Aspergillus terreus NIH2624]|uniref:Uncharacterized protein n=1 Tax=Aspergillus terreus (strain NIH 2624 / FGSC A1156) TaxID=341663 RepID=Q0CN05_ASPTN|nr:uncharacterized protein ATEG_04929 [Aspergillus terreus NIH2624]EAU35376.1 predicted protein [Aspergillus terreus NIH2624]